MAHDLLPQPFEQQKLTFMGARLAQVLGSRLVDLSIFAHEPSQALGFLILTLLFQIFAQGCPAFEFVLC